MIVGIGLPASGYADLQGRIAEVGQRLDQGLQVLVPLDRGGQEEIAAFGVERVAWVERARVDAVRHDPNSLLREPEGVADQIRRGLARKDGARRALRAERCEEAERAEARTAVIGVVVDVEVVERDDRRRRRQGREEICDRVHDVEAPPTKRHVELFV